MQRGPSPEHPEHLFLRVGEGKEQVTQFCCTTLFCCRGRCPTRKPVLAKEMRVYLVESKLCPLSLFSVLPVIEGSSVQESKSKMTHQGRRKTDIPACKGHRRVGQEVCYLCMQQEERNLRAALLEEKEKQERAERAQQQAWLASMAALSAQRRACAVLKMAVDKTETKEDLEESRDYLKFCCPIPAYLRRREYDRELQERREVWGWEPMRVPVKTSLRR
ncbi:uncharacterized protein M6G45_014930 [Spheniscus humboldti]